jgi:hypothetical protein
MYHNKEGALKDIPASLQEKQREKILCLRFSTPNHWYGIGNGKIIDMSGRKVATLQQKKQNVHCSYDEGTVQPSSFKKAKVNAVAFNP